MPPRLVSTDDKHAILLDKPIMLVGRDTECDIQLGSRKVSRRHCCIAQVEDHLVIRDLDSTNGIRINGTPVTEGQLKNNDELMIGNLRYQVVFENGHPRRTEKPSNRRPAVKPISVDKLKSCDMPIPLKEPAAAPPLPHAVVEDEPEADEFPAAPPVVQPSSWSRSEKLP